MKTQRTSPEDKAVVKVDTNHIPDDIPILPLDNQVAFPKTNMSLAVPMNASPLIETNMNSNQLIGVIGSQRKADVDLQHGAMYETGTVVRVFMSPRHLTIPSYLLHTD